MKAERVAVPAAQHVRGAAARREANQNALLRAPAGGDPVRVEILLQLVVDHVGGQQQRQFAQFRQAARVGHAAIAGTADQGVGRRIHDFDFVGFGQKGLGQTVGGALAGDTLHLVLLFADVLHVDGGDDADAAIQQFLDILPALGIAAAGRIVIGQAIDEAYARMAPEEGGQVDHLVGLCRRAARR